MPKYDAIVVPGGGLTEDGNLLEWSRRRLDKALEVHKGEPILVLSAYTVHKPPVIGKDGFPILEARVAADYLMSRGVDPRKIFMDWASFDTIGNAFLCRVLHTDPRGWKKLLIVNSDFHMSRTKAIFDWVFGLAPKQKYKLTYLTASDEGIDVNITSARREREEKSRQSVLEKRKKIKTMKKFHDWFFSQHEAYAVNLKPKQATGDVLKSY